VGEADDGGSFAQEAASLSVFLADASAKEDPDDRGGTSFSFSTVAACAAVRLAAGCSRRSEETCALAARETLRALMKKAPAEAARALLPSALAVAVAEISGPLSGPLSGPVPRRRRASEFDASRAHWFAELVDCAEGPEFDRDARLEAKRAAFGDLARVRVDPTVAAAAAAAAVRECSASASNDRVDANEQFATSALRNLFVSDLDRITAECETSAFIALRESLGVSRVPDLRSLGAVVGALGGACAAATLRRAKTCAGEVRGRSAISATAEGLKFWVAVSRAVSNLARGSVSKDPFETAQIALVATFLPLAIEAASPASGTPAQDLRAAANRLVTSLATSVPEAFRAAVTGLRPESLRRLRNAMAGGSAATPAGPGPGPGPGPVARPAPAEPKPAAPKPAEPAMPSFEAFQ
jgi:hypothetical protein